MVRLHRLLVPVAAVLALSGCMSIGGLGGYPGGGYPDGSSYPGQGYPPQQGYGQSIVGNVDQTDHGNGRFMMRTDGGGYGAYGNRIEINYDRNTPAYFRGLQVSPSGLETGDQIRVQATQSNGRWWARSIEVLQDVRGGGGYGSPYGNALGGSVTSVDARNGVLYFTRGGYSGSNDRVRFDQYTTVEYRGQRYRVDQLERGDVIRIEGRQVGNEFLAQRIIVDTSVRDRY